MSAPILATKLYIPPPRSRVVFRPRLIERLNEGLHHKLTLISAPAGFGKTTLVSEWVFGGERPAAWLSLDEGDNDPTRFLAYLVAALQTLVLSDVEGIATRQSPVVNIGERALHMLQSPQPPPIESVLTVLLNEITTVPNNFVVVLDDYHVIDAKPIDNALTFLLEHLPPQMHLVIATREDPSLPLARLRARSHLTELRATDLRFTSCEAAEFLNQVMGLNLSTEDIAVLETRTEGWIAGLQLAAISMQGRKDVSSFVKTFSGSHHFVLDYLIEEVLEQQSESVQTFLLQTAVIDRLTGTLCDALTGQDNGQATLEMLERANLFVIPLDEERRWYRYHHLFSDLLRQRLRQTRPDRVQKLHQQASQWYEQKGFADEAIEHTLRGKDFARAADMIEEHVDHVLHFGERAKLQRWLDEIPGEVTFSEPYLCILHAGNLYIRGRVDEAERYLQAADQALNLSASTELDAVPVVTDPKLTPDQMKLRGRAATVRSFLISYLGDVEGSIQHARQALEYLPKSDLTWRSSAFDSLGTAYSSIGDVTSAYHARMEALEASKAAGNVYMMLFASLRLVVTLRDLGRLQQAIDICRQQLKLADESGLSQTALVGWLYTLWGEMLAEKNELDRALQLVNKGVELTERGKDVALLGSSYLCLMRVLFSQGDMDSAKEIIQEVSKFTRKQELSPWITNQMAAWQARMWVAQEKLDSAYHWAEKCGLDVKGELTPLHDFDYAVLARILIAQGRLDETSRLLQRLFDMADAGGRVSKVIEIKTLQALTFQARGEPDRALSALKRALTLAEPGGFVRVFVDEGQPMVHLLNEALSRGIAPDYVRRLLTASSSAEPVQADITTSQVDQSELVEPLSERELEVLQNISEGLTNREIASRLYLSLNTVKVHTRNIYGKLGVNNRTQAVARARALGVLATS